MSACAFAPMSCSDPSRWYAVYTRPRHEKCAARQLEVRAIECFLPLYSAVRRWKHRRAVFELPLFPSYFFVCINRQQRLAVLTAPGVLQFVGTRGGPIEIEQSEIAALSKLLTSRNAYPVPYLQPGNRVRFSQGVFAGLEGTVVRTKGEVRVVVSVDAIMRSISIEADCSELQLTSRVQRPGSIRPQSTAA